jgi:hypothetical protein
MRWSLLLLALSLLSVCPAADWLAPGIHELETARKGITCTMVVPPAVSEAKAMPALFVVAQDGKPDAKRWQEWGERRSTVVVAINGLRWWTPIGGSSGLPERWTNFLIEAQAAYGAVLTTVKGGVPLHPFLRFIAGSKSAMPLAVAISEQSSEPFGGLLLIAPGIDAKAGEEMRKDVAVVMVVPDNENEVVMANRVMSAYADAGGTAKLATYDAAGDGEPAFDIHVRAMDWLMNIARATHGRLSARERKTNLEEIAKQAQELPGLVNPATRRECAGFLMSVPGMETLRRDYERLADVWVESTVELAKALEEKDAVEAHEVLSVMVKGKRFQDASAKQQKAAQVVLARMRKNPLIKQEIAASDLVADTCAMLDHDVSPAKQRIALKDLQAVLTQYPKTHAAKVAAKLVSQLQQNLR